MGTITGPCKYYVMYFVKKELMSLNETSLVLLGSIHTAKTNKQTTPPKKTKQKNPQIYVNIGDKNMTNKNIKFPYWEFRHKCLL